MSEKLAYEIGANSANFEQAFKRAQDAAKRLDQDIRKIGDGGNALNGLQSAVNTFVNSTGGLKVETEQAKSALDHFSFSTTGARRELLVLAHELSQGNYKQFAGSMLVLGEQLDVVRLLLSSTGLAVAGFAVAIGATATAIYKGYEESRQFNNAIQLTGNYAGITSGQLDTMSDSIANLTNGHFAESRAAIQAAVSSGELAGSLNGDVAQAAIRISSLSGESADKIVADFAKMARSTEDWAQKLNQQYNFLTPAQYQHIRRLQEQGNNAEALKEAMGYLNVELGQRTPESLGLAQRAWNNFNYSINSVWDSIKSIGRDTSVEDKIASKRKALQQLNEGGPIDYAGSPTAPQKAALIAEIESLEKQKADVVKQSEQAQQNQSRIDASKFVEDQIKTYRSGAQKMKEAIDEFNKKADLAGDVSPEQRKQVIDGIKKQFEGPGIQQKQFKLLGDDRGLERELDQQAQEVARWYEVVQQGERRHAQAMAQIEDQAATAKLTAGEITEERYIEILRASEERQYQDELSAYRKEQALEGQKPAFYAEVNNKIEALADQHRLKMAQIAERETQAQRASIAKTQDGYKQLFGVVTGAFSQSILGVIQGTQTWRQAMGRIFASIGQNALSTGLKMVGDWAAMEFARTSATTAGVATRNTVEAGGALSSLAISAGTGIKDIAIKGYQAAAGAYAAIAAIPYIGPFLAPAVSAAALAAVIGLGANIASASGGYDIPSGINPLVQAHAREMILPAKHADVIRALAENGGATGGNEVHVHLNALDTRTGVQWLMNNQHHVASALKAAYRNGSR